MNCRHSSLVSLVWLGCSLLGHAEPVLSPAATPGDGVAARPAVLDRISRIKALSPEEANQRLPVRLEAYVTFYDPRWKLLMLADEDGGLFVTPPDRDLGLEPNEKVLVEGVTGPGGFAPIVQDARIAREPGDQPPRPRLFSGLDLLSGQQDNAFVQVRGVILSTSEDDNHTLLRIATSMGVLDGIAPQLWSPEEKARLLDATVQFPAVCGSSANQRRQFTGIRLWIPDSNAVKVIDSAPAQPFSLPVSQTSSLLRYESNPSGFARARLRGVVTLLQNDHLFFLQDSSGGLRVQTRHPVQFAPGDAVEAVGYPTVGGTTPGLRHSITRVIGKLSGPIPRPASAGELLTNSLDATFISIEARYLGEFHREDGTWLSLESGGKYFEAQLQAGHSSQAVLREGSVLRLQGVCDTKLNEWREPTSFVVLLRGPSDIQVLSAPSWWTPERASLALGLASALIVLTGSWVSLLRRRVALQTAQIRRGLEQKASTERRYQSLFENAQDFVFTCDTRGTFSSFNRAGTRLTGFSQEEAAWMTLFQIVAADKHEKLTGLLSDPVASEYTQAELEIVTKSGQTRVVELTLSLLQREGRPTEVQGIARDVTERKRMEHELLQARDLAVRNAQQKAEFLANMSHEIRTPMNGVIGMTNLLLDTSLSPQQIEFTQTIRHSADALLTVVNDILDFSKIEAGKLSFEEIEFDLCEMVESAVDVLAERAVGKGLDLVLAIDPQAPFSVRGDPMRLRQILTNLIGNAVKFTSRGEVVVRVSAADPASDPVSLRFEIRDTGIGISKEVQAVLFRPFSQGEGSVAQTFGGTGLGLAISKQLVERMGGAVGVESELGQGATFWFTVPLPKGAALEPVHPTEAEVLRNLRALVVDDNAAQQEALTQQVAGWGLHCERVADSASALELLRRSAQEGQPFDLALVDLNLPVTDGLSLLQCISLDPLVARTHLILMSGFNQALTEEAMDASGIGACLLKPVKRSRLLDAMLRAVGAGPVASRSKATSEPAAAPRGTGLRIVLAEDNAINQKVALGQLSRLGYHPEVVSNGREMLDLFQPGRFDVIFMDCQMPEMDGYQATRQIRLIEQQHPEIPPVSIIAMTAHAMKGDREKCLEAGMDDYISKPIDREQLVKALDHCASAHPVQAGQPPLPLDRAPDVPVSSMRSSFQNQVESADEPSVDLERLLEAVGGIQEEAQALAVFFLEQAREMLDHLEAAVRTFTPADLVQVSHKLAGASASCGALGLLHVLREFEQAARSGTLTEAGAHDHYQKVLCQFAETEHFFSSCFPQPQEVCTQS